MRALVALRAGTAAEAADVPPPPPPAVQALLTGDSDLKFATAAAAPEHAVQCLPAAAVEQQQQDAECEELRRLKAERAALVATGIYGAGDVLIHQLDVRIGRLFAEQQASY